MSADPSLIDAARAWAAKDPDPTTTAQLQHALDKSQHDELHAAFAERISFGTAGLRAAMGFGPARMNVSIRTAPSQSCSVLKASSSQRLIIIETTAGLASHLLGSNPQANEQGVVIAYDGRHGSKECE